MLLPTHTAGVDRILSARGLDESLKRLRQAETDMASTDDAVRDRGMRKYAAADAAFQAAGGYAAELRDAPVGQGQQLCQRNCPISHVAAEFHEFCDAETEAISQALGVHVTRLSTISNGSEICTLHVPPRRSA